MNRLHHFKSQSRSRTALPANFGLMTWFDTVSSSTRLKCSEQTFSVMLFVCREMCVTTEPNTSINTIHVSELLRWTKSVVWPKLACRQYYFRDWFYSWGSSKNGSADAMNRPPITRIRSILQYLLLRYVNKLCFGG